MSLRFSSYRQSIVFDSSLFPRQKSGDSKPKRKKTRYLEDVLDYNVLRFLFPNMKRFCFNCNTPIHDEGDCPNCES